MAHTSRHLIFAVLLFGGFIAVSAASGQEGACCIELSCVDGLAAADCADNGGIWQGADALCANLACTPEPPCPPGARLFLNEDNCGAYVNTIFQTCCVPQITPPVCSLRAGFSAVCASASAQDGIRDQDLWSFSPTVDQQLTLCVTAPFYAHVQFIESSNPQFVDVCELPGDDIVGEVFGVPGAQSCLSACVRAGGTYGILATVVDANGMPLLDGVACARYLLQAFVDVCPEGACCFSPSGDCEILTEIACADAGGAFLGAGLVCDDVACEPNVQFCDPNCDGARSVADIGYFVTALAQGEAAWTSLFPKSQPSCTFESNDMNGDGFITVADISGFVDCLTSGG
ncbi:MAG: hypothetical protein AB7N71_02080 [Phycisphaerae bacterium]